MTLYKRFLDLENGYSFRKDEIVFVEYNTYSQNLDNENSYSVYIDIVLKSGLKKQIEFVFHKEEKSFLNYGSLFHKEFKTFEDLCRSKPLSLEIIDERKDYLNCILKLVNEDFLNSKVYDELKNLIYLDFSDEKQKNIE